MQSSQSGQCPGRYATAAENLNCGLRARRLATSQPHPLPLLGYKTTSSADPAALPSKMLRILFVVCVISKVHSHAVPLIYAAPSAVSHQSRIDIKHSPALISTPLIYSPATIFTSHPKEASETVLTPLFTSDTVFTPIALSFYHNLPLARALQHPISIDIVESPKKEDGENIDILPQEEKEISTEGAISMEKVSENIIQDNNESQNVEVLSENVTDQPQGELIVVESQT